ncbi:MAG: hypothetical protein HeimC3_48080 [Candidatus Heimdallarchaeota archaeon LC_3]|nr:MAG: hypothetical protein HeimC3_48080 [Candidatus Heimdallarchaeota archaeon LC_3]
MENQDKRTEFYFMHFFTYYLLVWVTLGLVIFMVILIISDRYVKRWFEEEVVAKVKRKEEKVEPREVEIEGEDEIIEEITDPKEQGSVLSDSVLTERAEE